MSSHALTLAGKHALVTGGATGIGFAIALALLNQGASVTIAGRSEDRLQSAMNRFNCPTRLNYVVLDVSDAVSVAQGFKIATEKFGPIEILINNAGQAQSAPFLKTELALWRQMLDVNLTGSFICAQQALPAMLQSGWGRIVNIASTAALKAYPYVAAYCAAKHGLIGLTRALACEVATKGVTVNAVCPGYTETELLQEALANIMQKTGRSEQEARAELAAHNPQKRLIQASEVADAVVWLCAPSSASQNGQAIVVAGGEVMG